MTFIRPMELAGAAGLATLVTILLAACLATLILQAVSWYLRYPLSYRDIEELFLERGLEVDHSTLNRWVLAYAPLIERRLRCFRKPHCGSVRIDETYIKIRGQ